MCLVALSAAAQEKIDPQSMYVLRAYADGTLDASVREAVFREPASRGGSPMVRVLVEKTGGAGSVFEEAGYAVTDISRDFSLVEMPVDDVEAFSMRPEVVSMSFGRVASTTMDVARKAGAVDLVHSGFGLGANPSEARAYKGAGVVAAIYDSGFDPGHVNWYDGAQTRNRLKYFYRNVGGAAEYRDGEAAKAYTDKPEATHATHVAGIMAGGYNGKGTYYGSANANMRKIPLYGVAPEADIAVGAGSLVTSEIVGGVKKLVDYASKQGKPVVVNLSLGSNDGPHDGSDIEVRALDQIVEETGAIICMASGNDCAYNCHASKIISDESGSMLLLFDGDKASSYVDVWSSSPDPITVSLVVVEAGTGRVVAALPSKPGETVLVGSGTDEASELFKSNFGGRIQFGSRLSGENKRYNVFAGIVGQIAPKKDNLYHVGLMVEAGSGARVDAYSTSMSQFAVSSLGVVDKPDANGSVSSLACGKNTICVGSFTSRVEWVNLEGQKYQYTGKDLLNRGSYFSSWGELADGRKLPHITAPGMGINSSYSSYFVEGGLSVAATLVATKTTDDDKTHYWALEQGTSMACPYVAGVIALWLEADPDLTAERARDILMSTATKDEYVTAATAWGAGKVNAYGGIKEVLKQAVSGIADVAVDGGDLLISQVDGGRTVDVFSAGASKVEVQLYTVGGAMAASASADGDSVQLSAENLAPGVYIVRAGDGSRTATRKIVL